jgi:hypothetical protein
MRKDAIAIAELLLDVGTEIMGSVERAGRLGGWCLDNTKANMKAMRILAQPDKRPMWVNVGCIAHGTALAMKDFCTVRKTAGRHSITWGVPWLADINDKANCIANYIQDASTAKVVLQHHQKEVYGSSRSITVNVPTRFATNYFVQKSIKNSSSALKQATSDDRWDRLGGKSAEASI